MEILILKGVEKWQAKKAAKAAIRAARAADGLSETSSMTSSRLSRSPASTPNRLSTAASLEKSVLRDVDVEKSDLLAPPAYQHVAAERLIDFWGPGGWDGRGGEHTRDAPGVPAQSTTVTSISYLGIQTTSTMPPPFHVIILSQVEPIDLAAVSRTCRNLACYIQGNRLLHRELYLTRYDEPLAPSPPDWEQLIHDNVKLEKILASERHRHGLSARAEPRAPPLHPPTGRADRPRRPPSPPDWEQLIHDNVKLEKILASERQEIKSDYLAFVAKQLDVLLQGAAAGPHGSLNAELLGDCFKDTNNVDAFLCASSLFARAGTESQQPAATTELQQASAKMHCLFGVPVDQIPSRSSFLMEPADPNRSPSLSTRSHFKPRTTHTFARSKVYDLRQYTEATLWGPFTDDGTQTVDWEKVEAIMIVLGFNLSKFSERSDGQFGKVWNTPFVGASPNSYTSLPFSTSGSEPAGSSTEDGDADQTCKLHELQLALDAQDPYGVSGSWMRVVCFLDYNDLYAFNFNQRTPDDQPREPIDTEEAIRLIRIKLQVVKIVPPGSSGSDEDDDHDDGLDWSGFTGTRLPVVHFKGTSKSLHASWDPNANSRIRGSVRQTPEGEIRWTTFSIFHGEERWRSEGVQVGGLRSARGVLGNWFDKDFDMHGPAGPTAFWKESDDMRDEEPNNTSSPPHADLHIIHDLHFDARRARVRTRLHRAHRVLERKRLGDERVEIQHRRANVRIALVVVVALQQVDAGGPGVGVAVGEAQRDLREAEVHEGQAVEQAAADADDHDGAGAAARVRGRRDAARDARALEHRERREVLVGRGHGARDVAGRHAVQRADLLGRLQGFFGRGDEVGADAGDEGGGEGQARGVDVRDGERPGAGRAGGGKRDEADGPGAADERGPAEGEAAMALLDGVQHDGQGLEQCALREAHARGDLVQVLGVVAHEAPDRARVRAHARELDRLAQVVLAARAQPARAARHARFDGHAVAGQKVRDGGADGEHDPAGFVPEDAGAVDHERADGAAVPQVHVGAADAGAADVDEGFGHGGGRDRGFRELETVVRGDVQRRVAISCQLGHQTVWFGADFDLLLIKAVEVRHIGDLVDVWCHVLM
nr:hypothetical protein CFP56_11773 [Quercus suber]